MDRRDKRVTMGSMLYVYSWVILVAGAVLVAGFHRPFSDGNLALMVGIGCLIAAPVVYIASFMFPLSVTYIEARKSKEKVRSKESSPNSVISNENKDIS